MLAQHLDLVMVGKDDHIVVVLYHRDLAKHPNVPIQSEDSQDQRIQFFSDFAGPEAMKHQVTQNLEWQLQTMRYPVMNNPTNAPELLSSRNLLWANHTTAATCDSTSVGCSTASTLAEPRRTNFPPRPRSRPPPTPPLLLRKYLTNCPTVGFLSTRDLAYWAIRKVFRASARTKAVWAAV